jgi:uncharacterized membrane-anchored protein
MSTALVRILIVLGALLVLGGVNYSIHAKEQVIRHGDVMYLELAPVDPRSLMQGDYMALRFAIAAEIARQRPEGNIALLQLDSRRVARMPKPGSADSGSVRVHFRMRNGAVWIGTNAYFFEEGSATRFTPARFGKFRVDPRSGEAVLVALCDDQLKEL